MAQSSDDGPRSPGGPGWMMIVRCVCHSRAGTFSFRNGQMTRSGLASSAASSITRSDSASSTLTS